VFYNISKSIIILENISYRVLIYSSTFNLLEFALFYSIFYGTCCNLGPTTSYTSFCSFHIFNIDVTRFNIKLTNIIVVMNDMCCVTNHVHSLRNYVQKSISTLSTTLIFLGIYYVSKKYLVYKQLECNFDLIYFVLFLRFSCSSFFACVTLFRLSFN
jgi:hypothetical protein